jgi:hypothetical protein
MKIQWSARPHKFFQVSDPAPFDGLKQDLVPHGISAAPQKPFAALRGKRISATRQGEIAAPDEGV